jgi:hypothetical protein
MLWEIRADRQPWLIAAPRRQVRLLQGRSVTTVHNVADTGDGSALPELVHRPGDGGDESGRSGFNLAIEHYPELIVKATGAADVVAAVRLAAREGRAVAVMNTGHGPTVPADGP